MKEKQEEKSIVKKERHDKNKNNGKELKEKQKGIKEMPNED